ncbi:hypothetical protein LTR94_032704, partial [Friedmanniomyces endolithicus]
EAVADGAGRRGGAGPVRGDPADPAVAAEGADGRDPGPHSAQLLRPADRGLFRRGGRLRRDPPARRDHHRRGHRHRPDAAGRDGGLRPGDRRPVDRGGRLLPVHDQPGGHRPGGDGDGGLLRLPAASAGAAQALARGGGHGRVRPAGRALGPVAAQH